MLKKAFGRSFMIFAALAALVGVFAYTRLGWQGIGEALSADAGLIANILPKLAAALFIASFLQVLLPQDFLSKLMGEGSGTRGMIVAGAAGALTPGGPMTSFPMVNVLHKAGTGIGQLVAYLTSWSTIGMQRVLVWEIPLLGIEFALIRFIASFPLALIAGLLAPLVPVPPEPEEEPRPGEAR